MLNKIKLVALGITVLGVVGVGAGMFIGGDGTVHVVAAKDGKLELLLNGAVVAPKLVSYEHQVYDIPQGKHELEVRDPATQVSKKYSLEISNGFADYLLPKDDTQCFARFDVTKAMYTARGGAPEVKDRWSKIEPIDVPGTVYWDEDETPKSIKEGNSVYLLLPVACSAISGSDDAILAEVGF